MKHESFKEFLEEAVDRNHDVTTKVSADGKNTISRFDDDGNVYQIQVGEVGDILGKKIPEYSSKRIGEASFLDLTHDDGNEEGFKNSSATGNKLGSSI